MARRNGGAREDGSSDQREPDQQDTEYSAPRSPAKSTLTPVSWRGRNDMAFSDWVATPRLSLNERRITKCLYRAPGSDKWEEKPLDWMMEQIAQRVKKTRDETFVERLPDGKVVNQTLGIFSLGGATMDNEWNYAQCKLLRGLGVVAIENQARI